MITAAAAVLARVKTSDRQTPQKQSLSKTAIIQDVGALPWSDKDVTTVTWQNPAGLYQPLEHNLVSRTVSLIKKPIQSLFCLDGK